MTLHGSNAMALPTARRDAALARLPWLADSAAWFLSLIAAEVLRYEFDLSDVAWRPLLLLAIAAIGLQLLAGWLLSLYRGRHPLGSFEEVMALLLSVLGVVLVLALPVALLGTQWHIPRSTVFVAAPLSFVLMGGTRYALRLVAERRRGSRGTHNTLVYGAGDMGAAIIKQMLGSAHDTYHPVGLIDDDLAKRNVWLHGIRVLGTGAELLEVARRTRATTLVITIAHADAALLRDLSDLGVAAGLQVKVLPSLEEVLEGKSRIGDLRDVSIADLIGRHPVETDFESVAGYLRGRRVLVTGAGGSIGSELCRQVAKIGPSELILLDHDESALHGAQLSILGHGLLDTRDVVLVDIRDREALARIFAERRPEVVFHAAALKHLPMLEQYPDEAWKTNVLGTLNVLEVALESGVRTLVNISTDKAANPSSVLGHSKRVAEKLTSWASSEGRTYLSVRFGNVIGSRGSVVPTFVSMIEQGGPIMITHPDVSRYFMTISEACRLVVQAGGIGKGGEVLILDMGAPVRIMDVAKRMIEMSGKDIPISVVGLRQGEKLSEDLIGDNERAERSVHPMILHARVAPMVPENLDKAEWLRRTKHDQSTTTESING